MPKPKSLQLSSNTQRHTEQCFPHGYWHWKSVLNKQPRQPPSSELGRFKTIKQTDQPRARGSQVPEESVNWNTSHFDRITQHWLTTRLVPQLVQWKPSACILYNYVLRNFWRKASLLKIKTAGRKTRAIFHNRNVCVASEWVRWEFTSMWS